jgi:hypothetical protein
MAKELCPYIFEARGASISRSYATIMSYSKEGRVPIRSPTAVDVWNSQLDRNDNIENINSDTMEIRNMTPSNAAK